LRQRQLEAIILTVDPIPFDQDRLIWPCANLYVYEDIASRMLSTEPHGIYSVIVHRNALLTAAFCKQHLHLRRAY
jgi:hypothetical protein